MHTTREAPDALGSFRAAVLLILLAAALLEPLRAATFVVPSDREMVRRAQAIVVGEALASHTRIGSGGAIETVTSFSVEETVKGSLRDPEIEIVEPGGLYGDEGLLIAGIPRFPEGQRAILFLSRIPGGRWAVTDIALGKFTFETDRSGQRLAVRNESDITGWDPDLTPHIEARRAAAPFLDYLRATGSGLEARADYVVPYHPLEMAPSPSTPAKRLHVAGNSVFSATSYTLDIGSGGENAPGTRWNVFPVAVNWNQGNTEPGALNGGTAAIDIAFAAWNGVAGANIKYVLATSNPVSNGFLENPHDNINNIVFEKDLSSKGVAAFSCSNGGVLGMAGIHSALNGVNGHTLNGETFYTTKEADVSMNQGLANCASLMNSGDFNSGVTHEVGHTLSLRHADANRINGAAGTCAADPNLECAAGPSIMKVNLQTGLNSVLQDWDKHAVIALYPAPVSAPAAPAIVATATAPGTVAVSWSSVSGATSYDVYRRSAGGGFSFTTNTVMTSFNDSSVSAGTAYLYRVIAKNAGGSSPDSNLDLATTIIFVDDPLVVRTTLISAAHLTQLRTAVSAVRALAGLSVSSFTDPVIDGSVSVKAVHVSELRGALDPARSTLALPPLAYGDAVVASGGMVKASHFQEVRTGVK